MSGLYIAEEFLALLMKQPEMWKDIERRNKQLASLLTTLCQSCGEMTENCIDNEDCGRCPECWDLPHSCDCTSRCPVCRGWKCTDKECAMEMKADYLADAGRD